MSLLSLSGITKSFPGPPPVDVLHGIDLDIAHGEYVAITGPSGSGKSTLLNLLGLLDSPTSGSLFFDGIDASTLRDKDRAALRATKIGLVFQRFNLIDGRSTVENIALGQLYQGIGRKTRYIAAQEAAARVGLDHRLDADCATMSGGERQRVTIARALVSKPPLLLCDEPTGNLDSTNAHHVFDLLADLHRQGQTIVVITHDESFAAQAPRQIKILDGIVQ